MKEKSIGSEFSLHGNIRGFSMVGVIMAFGMLGGLALVLARLSAQQMGLQKKIESQIELSSLTQQIGRTIYDHTSCIKTIKKDSSGNSTRLVPGSIIDLKHIKNKSGKKVFRKNRVYGNGLIKILTLSLIDITVAGTTAETNLHIAFEKIAKTIKGHNKASKIYPLSVEVNASGKPLSCYSELNATIATAKKQICEDFGTYDPTSETCRSSIAIQCPQGQIVSGFDGDGNILCNTLSSQDPHPAGYNCFLLGNYTGNHGLMGQFQPIWATRKAPVLLERWMYCPFGTSGVTSCKSVSLREADPLTCPTGYTLRYISPTDSINGPRGGEYIPVSTHFLMEHYCCK